ncbi:MAG: Ni/Fe hydrogenase subunit alpha [Nitrospirae bacterium]|nr:Ni/Fe hydrogenase subunit alpha [Nitrospirota bacterium]
MKEELITRIEGHANVKINVKGQKLESIKLDVLTPPRLFEKLIVGRRFNDVPTIVSRICSICAASHRIVSVMAIESAFGVKIREEAKLLRELLLHGESLQSHGLHLFMLALPDYYGKNSFVELATDMPEVVSLGFKIKGLGNEIQQTIGGRAIHQIIPVAGGMSAAPSREDLKAIRDKAEPLIDAVAEFLKQIPPMKSSSLVQVKNWVSLAGNSAGDVLINGKEQAGVEKFWQRMNESSLPPSYTKHTLLENEPFMVGPLARMLNAAPLPIGRAADLIERIGVTKDRSVYMNNLARGVEIVIFLEEVTEIINKLLEMNIPEDSGIIVDVIPKAGKGFAAVEAPRGLLLHTYTFDSNGYITEGDIVTPTALNLAEMERGLSIMAEALLKEKADIIPELETLIRAFDPCISCSVHVVNL